MACYFFISGSIVTLLKNFDLTNTTLSHLELETFIHYVRVFTGNYPLFVSRETAIGGNGFVLGQTGTTCSKGSMEYQTLGKEN